MQKVKLTSDLQIAEKPNQNDFAKKVVEVRSTDNLYRSNLTPGSHQVRSTVISELLTHRKSECRKRSDFSFTVFRVNHCLSPNNRGNPTGIPLG